LIKFGDSSFTCNSSHPSPLTGKLQGSGGQRATGHTTEGEVCNYHPHLGLADDCYFIWKFGHRFEEWCSGEEEEGYYRSLRDPELSLVIRTLGDPKCLILIDAFVNKTPLFM